MDLGRASRSLHARPMYTSSGDANNQMAPSGTGLADTLPWVLPGPRLLIMAFFPIEPVCSLRIFPSGALQAIISISVGK